LEGVDVRESPNASDIMATTISLFNNKNGKGCM
jgi:hypothetical protein